MSVITCRSNQLRKARELWWGRCNDTCYNYVGGTSGAWEVSELTTYRGPPLVPVSHLEIINGPMERTPSSATWVFSGFVQNTRYVSREELLPPSSRRAFTAPPPRTCAALIPLRRSKEWWQLGDAVRREIQQSQQSSLRYLSAMVRRWRHRLDLSDQFDCVTWFEYEPQDSSAFEDLLADWRASEEWKYIDRECDIRLVHSC